MTWTASSGRWLPKCLLLGLVAACSSGYGAVDLVDAGGEPVRCGNPPITCPVNASCEDGASGPRCVCKPGFEGDTCACPTGSQDNDRNGSCAPSCSTHPCPAHASCDDSSGAFACTCVVGYTRTGDACVWTGVVADPGFKNTPPQAWAATAGTVDPADPGLGSDPGAWVVPGPIACASGATIAQTISLPPASLAEPLAVTYSDQGGITQIAEGTRSRLRIGGRTVAGSGYGANFGTRKSCLGESLFGQAALLEARRFPENVTDLCPAMNTPYRVDSINVFPDPTCAPFGTIVDPSFEATGWAATQSSTGSARVEPGVGTGGSRAAMLTASDYCQQPALFGRWAVPTKPRTALRFSYRGIGPAASRLKIVLQDAQLYPSLSTLAEVGPSNVFRTVSVCLNEGLLGFSGSLTLRVQNPKPVFTGPCGVSSAEYIVDDLAFVEDPACPAGGPLVDPGFEASLQNWESRIDYYGAVVTSSARSVPGGRTGGALSLSLREQCGDPGASALFARPPGTSPTRIRFWVRQAQGSAAALNVYTSSSSEGPSARAIPLSGAWTEQSVCLSSASAGEIGRLTFAVSSTTADACGVVKNEEVLIDDISFVDDVTCPP